MSHEQAMQMQAWCRVVAPESVTRRWVNPDRGRYYIAIVAADLFGGWHLMRYWGSLESHRGGAMSEYCSDWQVVEEALGRIAARRRQHDYVEA